MVKLELLRVGHLRFLPRAFDGTAVSEAQSVSLKWISASGRETCDARTNPRKRTELGRKGNTARPRRNISRVLSVIFAGPAGPVTPTGGPASSGHGRPPRHAGRPRRDGCVARRADART